MSKKLTIEEKITKATEAVIKKATAEAAANNLNDEDTKSYINDEVAKVTEKIQSDKINTKEDTEEKTYMVKTPTDNFNGEVAGVQFAYGQAEVKDGWVLEWFKERGYLVEEIEE